MSAPSKSASSLSILLPTDFSEGSMLAFCHALKIAVAYQARLSILHVENERSDDAHWSDFPGVRETLQRWGLLSADAPRSDVFSKLSVGVEKIDASGRVIPSIINFLDSHAFDVMVLATHGRDGLPAWLHPSIAEPLARKALLPTLFVPHGARGFVSQETGEMSMNRLLMPIDHDPSPRYALPDAMEVLKELGNEQSELTLLHVGHDGPSISKLDGFRGKWTTMKGSGSKVNAILETADKIEADMILMVTAGHQGFLDVIRGSTSERVLRHAPCPVLTIPGAQDRR